MLTDAYARESAGDAVILEHAVCVPRELEVEIDLPRIDGSVVDQLLESVPGAEVENVAAEGLPGRHERRGSHDGFGEIGLGAGPPAVQVQGVSLVFDRFGGQKRRYQDQRQGEEYRRPGRATRCSSSVARRRRRDGTGD